MTTNTATNPFDDFDLQEDLLWRGVKSNNPKENISEETSNKVEEVIRMRLKDMWDSL